MPTLPIRSLNSYLENPGVLRDGKIVREDDLIYWQSCLEAIRTDCAKMLEGELSISADELFAAIRDTADEVLDNPQPLTP